MFKNQSKSARLAIAVRDDSLLAAEIKKQKKTKAYLQAWSACSLPKGVVQKGKLIKPQLFQQKVQQLLKETSHGHFTESNCHLVLPEELYQHHIARVKTPNTDFSPEVFNQAMLNIVHKADHERKKHGQIQNDLSTWVHSSASFAVKDYQRYEQVLTELGLSISSYSSSAQAASAFYFMGGKCAEPLLWVHIGLDQTEFALMDAYGIYQSGAVDQGVNQVMACLQSTLGYPKEKVALIIEHFGMCSHKSNDEKKIQEVFAQWLSEIIHHAKPLKTLSTLHHDIEPTLLCCGQGAHIPGVAEALEKELELALRVQRSWSTFIPQLQKTDYHQLVSVLGAVLS